MKYPFHNPDEFVVTACFFLFGIACFLFLCIAFYRKKIDKVKTLELSDKRIYATVDNIQTRATMIARIILKADNENKLYEALSLVKKYELDYPEDINAANEVKDLNRLFDIQLSKFFEVV